MPFFTNTLKIISINTLTNNQTKFLLELKSDKNGIIEILVNDSFAFYAITPDRLKSFLRFEEKQKIKHEDLSNKYSKKTFSKKQAFGKFAMHDNWNPGKDFLKLAAVWGIYLKKPVNSEELASFTSYWQAEGKLFHHVQWQQKLARNIQISRTRQLKSAFNQSSNSISDPDTKIPIGFRGKT